MKNGAAAIILCAGKGTRMNDDSKNKVAFDCAGKSVIRRIIDNMRSGGVSRFIIVAGHKAESVMDALDGVPGVLYTYQKEQKGTGHAALLGLTALEGTGYEGPVIVSMGDKIIAPGVISGLIQSASSGKTVWGVQPLEANPSGGRVVTKEKRPYGVVEFADAALEALAYVPEEKYRETLAEIGLNAKKAEKVLKKAAEKKPCGYKTLGGERFEAEELLHTAYANAGLYCFDAARALEVVGGLGSDNAQGEIYLTDALEVFAEKDEAILYEVKKAEDMLTYSTRDELRAMSRHFLRSASDHMEDVREGRLDGYFEKIYRGGAEDAKARYLALLDKFKTAYGDCGVIITRAPGRVNLMGRHIDHRGGGVNVMATDRDTVFAVSPREDDQVLLTNTNGLYEDRCFSIGEELRRADHKVWLEYLESENVKAELEKNRGDWSNYVKGALFRAQTETDWPLCGMNIAADGNIPVAAGLSSSSSLVVASLEALKALNSLNMTDDDFIRICGEGEWYVGSRGGAGDHAAMKCSGRGKITHLGFKPFTVGVSAAFSDRYAVIVANSMIKAKKSEGSRDTFNARVAAYEFAFLLLKKAFPACDLKEFRDLAKIRPYVDIYRMLLSLPEKADRAELLGSLPEEKAALERIFENHADPGSYALRDVALYGISECARAEHFMELLTKGDYPALGRMMKVSHDGDRVKAPSVTDEMLEKMMTDNAEPAEVSGAYGCSTEEIDALCDLLNETDGVLGSELVGAGLGGCVIALTEKEKASAVIEKLNRQYYDKKGFAHSAYIFSAAEGSTVLF